MDILSAGLSIIDKVLPDQAAKDKAKKDLIALQQSGELKQIEAELQDIADARAHDKASYGNSVVDFFRGMVRPVITLAAFAFYVFAKYKNIGLTYEDYAIIGMVLAFWFGGRFLSKDAQHK